MVSEAIRRATEAHFRECGNGSRECVTFWAASRTASDIAEVARVIHPQHAATLVSTQVGPDVLYDINESLYTNRQMLVAQLHIHPGPAFHSATDDAFPIVQSPGFYSIVLPDFGSRGLKGMPGCFVAEFSLDLDWRALAKDERETFIQWR